MFLGLIINIRALRILLSLWCFSILGLCLGVKSTEIQEFNAEGIFNTFWTNNKWVWFFMHWEIVLELATPKVYLVLPIPNFCEFEITSSVCLPAGRPHFCKVFIKNGVFLLVDRIGNSGNKKPTLIFRISNVKVHNSLRSTGYILPMFTEAAQMQSGQILCFTSYSVGVQLNLGTTSAPAVLQYVLQYDLLLICARVRNYGTMSVFLCGISSMT